MLAMFLKFSCATFQQLCIHMARTHDWHVGFRLKLAYMFTFVLARVLSVQLRPVQNSIFRRLRGSIAFGESLFGGAERFAIGIGLV